MKKRRKKKKNRPEKYVRQTLLIPSLILIIIFIISFGLLQLYQYINNSPYLRLRKVIINGCENETKKYIMDLLNPNNRNINIIFLNIKELKKKIEMHPWISSANIRKQFPDTLIINIKKEIPKALILLSNDIFYVNLHSYIFKKAKYGEKVDMPVITGLDPDESNFKKRLRKAIKILDIFKKINGDKYNISEVYITKYGNVHLYLYNRKTEVILSHNLDYISEKDVLKKLQRLKKVLNCFSNYARIKFKFIDMDTIEKGVIIGLSR